MNIIKIVGSKFIGGTNNAELLETIRKINARHNWVPIVDYAKESSRTEDDVKSYVRTLYKTIKKVNHDYDHEVSYAIKLSSFLPVMDRYDVSRVVDYMLTNGAASVYLDAESTDLKEIEDYTYESLAKTFNKNDALVYKTYQLYRKDSMQKVKSDLQRHENIGLKLVRGAYLNIDRHTGKLYTKKHDTDKNYDDVVESALEEMKQRDGIRLMLATHNNLSVEKAIRTGVDKRRVSFAQLLGMNDSLSHTLASSGHKVYKYVPYGNIQDTLPYLTRRLYENCGMIKHMLRL